MTSIDKYYVGLLNVCLVIPAYLRLWAVIGARWEPFCPAQCELTLLQLHSVILSK